MTALWVPLALALFGFWGKQQGWFSPVGAQTLHQYVIRVALPALVLTKIPHLEWNSDLWIPVAVAWIAVVLGFIWARLMGHFLSLTPRDRGVVTLLVALGNTSFLGIPLIQSAFGHPGVPIAILYDQLGSFLALALLGQGMLATPHATRTNWRQLVAKVLRFPPFVALLVAMMLGAMNIDQRWLSPLEPVGASLVPVVMVALGIQFEWSIPREEKQWLCWGLVGKMLVAPAVILAIVLGLRWHGISAQASVVEAAMPPMMSAAALVSVAGYRERFAAAMVAWGALLAFLTIPLWAELVRHLL